MTIHPGVCLIIQFKTTCTFKTNDTNREYRRTYLLPKIGERKNGSNKDLGNPKSGSGGGVISGHFDTNLEVEVSFCLLRGRINSQMDMVGNILGGETFGIVAVEG